MRKILLIITSVLLLFNTIVNGQTLHAIVFGDTKDALIGNSVNEDIQNMITLMSLIYTENDFKIKEHYYIGDDCNKENVIKVLQNLVCSQQDVVFFYYSGHGARSESDKSKFPQMCLGKYNGDYMPLYQVDEFISKKSPKLRIVMADCCNSFVPGLTPKSEYGNGKAVVNKSQPVTVLKTLFGSTSGSIIVSSSEEGNVSYAWTTGGAFTCCFRDELERMKEGQSPITWNILLEKTKTTTYRETSNGGKKGHTPIFEINIDGQNNQTQATAIVIPQSDNPFISALINMADNGNDALSRIRLVEPVLKDYFSNSNAVVEKYSQNGRTMLGRENARDFLEQVSTSFKLINFCIMPDSQTDSNGKYTYLKIKEIYKQ